jgi:hypothetical protein
VCRSWCSSSQWFGPTPNVPPVGRIRLANGSTYRDASLCQLDWENGCLRLPRSRCVQWPRALTASLLLARNFAPTRILGPSERVSFAQHEHADFTPRFTSRAIIPVPHVFLNQRHPHTGATATDNQPLDPLPHLHSYRAACPIWRESYPGPRYPFAFSNRSKAARQAYLDTKHMQGTHSQRSEGRGHPYHLLSVRLLQAILIRRKAAGRRSAPASASSPTPMRAATAPVPDEGPLVTGYCLRTLAHEFGSDFPRRAAM